MGEIVKINENEVNDEIERRRSVAMGLIIFSLADIFAETGICDFSEDDFKSVGGINENVDKVVKDLTENGVDCLEMEEAIMGFKEELIEFMKQFKVEEG